MKSRDTRARSKNPNIGRHRVGRSSISPAIPQRVSKGSTAQLLGGHSVTAALSEEPVVCSICLVTCESGEKLRQAPCSGGHLFHERCACRWFQDHGTCPLCRQDLTYVV